MAVCLLLVQSVVAQAASESIAAAAMNSKRIAFVFHGIAESGLAAGVHGSVPSEP